MSAQPPAPSSSAGSHCDTSETDSSNTRSTLGLTIEEINMLYSPASSMAFDFSPSEFSVNGGLMSTGSIMSVGLDPGDANNPYPFVPGMNDPLQPPSGGVPDLEYSSVDNEVK
jgi:hypothetical protein